MNVQRQIYLNPIEPAALSFRVPLGIETKLIVTFMGQDGAPWPMDLAAQLQLTGRSTARTQTYFMPATDVVNGKARAFIPADTLTDANGYRLRVMGTYQGEPALLAMGTLLPIAGAGPEAMPEDVIDQIDLVLTRGSVGQVGVKLWDDTDGTNPFDLATATISSSVYESRGGTMLVPFTVAIVASNEVLLTLTVEQVDTLPDLCWWSLMASNASGAHTLCEGTVTVKDAPT